MFYVLKNQFISGVFHTKNTEYEKLLSSIVDATETTHDNFYPPHEYFYENGEFINCSDSTYIFDSELMMYVKKHDGSVLEEYKIYNLMKLNNQCMKYSTIQTKHSMKYDLAKKDNKHEFLSAEATLRDISTSELIGIIVAKYDEFIIVIQKIELLRIETQNIINKAKSLDAIDIVVQSTHIKIQELIK